jgi:hypothetical protein
MVIFYSKNMSPKIKSYGYYSVTLASQEGCYAMRSNSERAFVVSQLQDLLSPRLLLTTIPPYKQFASCIDLLGFSITREAIRIVLFAIDASSAARLATCLMTRLTQYQSEYHPHKNTPPQLRVAIKRLHGPHQALAQTVALHTRHEDWEYDRYSSIGFYLHDRRGDWMRIWRLTQLYNNDAENYYALLKNRLKHPSTQEIYPTTPTYAS